MSSLPKKAQRIILLDRSAVITMERLLNNKPTEVLKQREARLHDADVPENTISPLLSIMEGATQINWNASSTIETIKREVDIVKSFFINAASDEKYLNKNM